MTINPKFGPEKNAPNFEFDVACVRGYQLFAFACTTSDSEGLCKHKLLEAIVRAEQLGGSEARVALVCCIEKPDRLLDQLSALFHRKRLRVFGRDHLANLREHLWDWMRA